MDEKKEYIQNLLEILLKNSQLDNESSGKKWIADWIDSWVDIFRALSTDFKSKKKQLYYENYESAKYLKKCDETDVEQRFTDPYFLGQIELNEYETLNIYTIRCKDTLSERSSKKIQYEISKCILKNDSNYEVNLSGGIFIFYDTKAAFRFSLIYDIPYGTKRLWSNFRRYTYFVSKDQTNKTFIDRLSSCAFKSLENVIDAFSVEKVTKDFYTELENWYFWAMDKVRFPDDYLTLLSKGEESYLSSKKESLKVTSADELLSNNLIRLITRIIFIWFLKQKNLINNSFFDETYLNTIIKDFKKGNNYYNAILQNLFFATLNQHIKNRAFIDEGDFETNKKQYGVKTLFRYKDRFKIPESEVLKLFSDIPFVNGGLFECLDQEYEKKEDGKSFVIYIDGFSRNPRKQAIIPDKLFFDEQISYQDLSRFGLNSKSSIRGLINILSSYNFTIDENTPQDLEVALDPELLGKVFENLLASYNPETSTSARKATGSYYTPREIVDYMALETIVMYLNQRTNISDKVLRELFSYNDLNDLEVKLTSDEVKLLIDAINQMKVLDPACGSGAFPMGILHKLVYLLERIDPDNTYFKEIQYNIAIKEAEDAFQQNDKEKRKSKLEEINDIFDERINYPDYARKLFLIENCIYGVDIQPIAVQITKLRFFISLLIDQKTSKDRDNNFGIRALPNLETRFISANTLIGLEKPENNDVFLLENIEDLENELKNLRNSYFEAKTREDKLSKQTEDKDLREKIEAKLIELGYNDMESHKIASFDPYDLNAHASWFDPEWMFGVKEGFDIVIGNPPYGIEFSENEKEYFKKQYLCTKTIPGKQKGSLDSFSLFIEKGFNILKRNGNLIYIVPISVTSSDSMTALHNLLEKNCKLIKISSFAVRPQPIFQNAVINTSILFFIKTLTPVEQILCTKMYRKGKGFDLKTLLENLQFIDVKNYKLYGRYPKISMPIETNILDKLFSIKTKIKDLVRENGKPIYYRFAGGRYFKVITPYETGSSAEKIVYFDKLIANSIGVILSTNLFFWYYQIFSDNLNLKYHEIESFPIPINELSEERIKVLETLYDDYLKDIEKNAKIRTTEKYANIDTFKEYKIGKSKKYIDAIDDFIGSLYGLNEEEIKFIKNYEIEFRLTENEENEN